MAGGLQQSVRGGRGRRRAMSEINVTPFVDVMLVLLIIFMVTAPLLVTGVEVNLPKATAPTLPDQRQPLVVDLQADGTITLQEQVIPENELQARLRAIAENSPDTRIYVRADEALAYGEVMRLMSLINNGGFNKAALVVQPPGSR